MFAGDFRKVNPHVVLFVWLEWKDHIKTKPWLTRKLHSAFRSPNNSKWNKKTQNLLLEESNKSLGGFLNIMKESHEFEKEDREMERINREKERTKLQSENEKEREKLLITKDIRQMELVFEREKLQFERDKLQLPSERRGDNNKRNFDEYSNEFKHEELQMQLEMKKLELDALYKRRELKARYKERENYFKYLNNDRTNPQLKQQIEESLLAQYPRSFSKSNSSTE